MLNRCAVSHDLNVYLSRLDAEDAELDAIEHRALALMACVDGILTIEDAYPEECAVANAEHKDVTFGACLAASHVIANTELRLKYLALAVKVAQRQLKRERRQAQEDMGETRHFYRVECYA